MGESQSTCNKCGEIMKPACNWCDAGPYYCPNCDYEPNRSNCSCWKDCGNCEPPSPYNNDND